jgi:hypothetical protein
LLRLVEWQRREGGVQDVSEAINAALEFWLDAKTALPAGADPSNLRGYQWKSLFLPEGTVLRSWSYGEHNYARVEGDKIVHEGRSVTPNEFARYFARTARNAWFDLSIRRPGDKQFTMANVLRKELAKQAKQVKETAPLPLPVTITAAGAPIAADAPARATRSLPSLATSPSPSPAPIRNIDREPGWDLPERRKFRYRLEDVAY